MTSLSLKGYLRRRRDADWSSKGGEALTRKELEQLKFLKNEVRLLEQECMTAKTPMIADTVVGCTPSRIDKHVITIRGIDYAKIDRINRRLDRKIAELQDEMDRLNDYIDSIPDSEMRQIIQLRYRNGLGWQQIAHELGYDRTTVAKKHNTFLSTQ